MKDYVALVVLVMLTTISALWLCCAGCTFPDAGGPILDAPPAAKAKCPGPCPRECQSTPTEAEK